MLYDGKSTCLRHLAPTNSNRLLLICSPRTIIEKVIMINSVILRLSQICSIRITGSIDGNIVTGRILILKNIVVYPIVMTEVLKSVIIPNSSDTPLDILKYIGAFSLCDVG